MYILGFVLLIVGAAIGYSGKQLYEQKFKKEPENNEHLPIKLAGLILSIIGAIIIFTYLR